MFNTTLIVYIFFSCFFEYFVFVRSCDGYELQVNQFENCGTNNVLKLTNFNVSLGKDCKIIPSGCAETTKKMTTAKINYKITKAMVPITGTKDACQYLGGAPADIITILNFLALPTSCPMEAVKVCGSKNKPIDISKFKRKLPVLLGNIKANVNVSSDAGSSCILFEGVLRRSGALGKLPGIGR